jgi:LacI family transcriptional regulator
MSGRVTMSEVAKRAGVSLMTVSRVINNKDDVSIETRQRVWHVIETLGYRPSAIARSLATKQTRTIGLVIPDVSNPFFADITRGVERLAYAQGYHVFLCNSEEKPQRELALIQSLEEKRVDGFILCSSRLDEEQLSTILMRLPPAVLVNRQLTTENCKQIESVLLDDEKSSYEATKFLIEKGHNNIGFLAGPTTSFSGRRRLQGYTSALREAEIQIQKEWILPCQPSVEGGDFATRQILSQSPQISALFCYNDLVAIGALQACHQNGGFHTGVNGLRRRIPQDLAVVGHDDIPLAAQISPSLTTCRVPREEIGHQAALSLINQIQGNKHECSSIILNAELIVRESAY